ALVFAFNQFTPPPLFFNKVQTDLIAQTEYAGAYEELDNKHSQLQALKREKVYTLTDALHAGDETLIEQSREELALMEKEVQDMRKEAHGLIGQATGGTVNDVNYIFLPFVMDYLPAGLIGLLIAVILLASMGSVAAAYNSLASTTVIDIYQRLIRKDDTSGHYVRASR